MAGITSTLNIAQGALIAQQYGLTVTGHNIANANNPDYSRQNADHLNNTPALYAGHLFGTGVAVDQVKQTVDQLLENRLSDEKAVQAGLEEAESYMSVLEGFFDENSEAGINSIMTDFWNSWHDISDNPLGTSERVAVYENGKKMSQRLNSAATDLINMEGEINSEIDSTITQINEITSRIAGLNQEILGLELNRTANDQRDQRNALVDELATYIDVDTFEQTNGSLVVNVAGGLTVVNGVDNYELGLEGPQVVWQGSYGSTIDISDRIDGGKLGGWLEVRDEVIPKYRNEIDTLAREMIWAVNYQHSQGAGLEYFTDGITGDYKADQSRLLSSLDYGDKIDYSRDFAMWVKDDTTSDTQYRKTEMDMGISQAAISDWQGVVPNSEQSRYKLTVMDSAILGKKEVTETDGINLAEVRGSTGDVAAALNGVIADQIISVFDGPSGTQKFEIKDAGGDAQRSAASIAEALSAIDGVEAHASDNSATFDVANITNAHDGDEIKFSLYVEGVVHAQSFVRDSDSGTLAEQFENAIRNASETINNINDDQDLVADGMTITSSAGRTLGVQDFEVQDNAGVRLENFVNFDADATVSFAVDSNGTPATTTTVSVDLSGIDITDQAAMSSAFAAAMERDLADKPFSVEHDPSTNSVILRTTDGSDITIKNGGGYTDVDAGFDMVPLSGSVDPGNVDNVLDFTGGADTATYNAVTTSRDYMVFSGRGTGVAIHENSSAVPGDGKAGVIAGTVTIITEPGMSIYSDATGAGGLFNGHFGKTGSSIMTLGGDGGFSNFTAGETISFDVDGNSVSFMVPSPGDVINYTDQEGNPATFTVGAGGISELQLAIMLTQEINNDFAGADPDYQVVRTGKSVSIIKDKALDDPIEITNFTESDIVPLGDGNNAALRTSTGTGTTTHDPVNDLLESGNTYRDFSTSSLYTDEGIIKWEKYDADGIFTGEEGLISVEDEGRMSILEQGGPSLSFEISRGSLVAGNTLTVNTDTAGRPDPLNFRVRGEANSKNELYQFTVVSGGKVGELPGQGEEPLVIEWKNNISSGSFEIEGSDPPITPGAPVDVEVDGMTLKFYDGTLFKDDVFTITTDSAGTPVSLNDQGQPTGEISSDWHWSLDSFADEFNRRSEGMKASVTLDNRMNFESSDEYYAVTNVNYSASNGFVQDNVTITVKDWSALNFKADDLQFVRNSDGSWGLLNDPTGGVATFIPDGGDDDGFGIDFSGDGLADMEISFAKKVTGQGYVELDLVKRSAGDLSFAFSDDATTDDSGLLAALGINTFFKGHDAISMETNGKVSDTKYITAAVIDSQTGEISQGDNSNALYLADVQYREITMKQWEYDRGSDVGTSLVSTTLDNYYSTMMGTMGIKARSVKSSREFADIMVNNMTQQRDAVSAVSLDEEMIKLIKYQHAFSAASKLVTVSDEMLNTLIGMR